jgi:hypothetical protein
MTDECKPTHDKQGRATGWGHKSYEQLYGPEGWCMADKPAMSHR